MKAEVIPGLRVQFQEIIIQDTFWTSAVNKINRYPLPLLLGQNISSIHRSRCIRHIDISQNIRFAIIDCSVGVCSLWTMIRKNINSNCHRIAPERVKRVFTGVLCISCFFKNDLYPVII